MRYRTVLFTGILLSLFTVIGATLVAYTFENTKARIAANERASLLRNLHVLLPPDSHTNDLFRDVIEVQDPTLLGSRDPVQVYRARRNGEPVALVMTPEAPDGYSGAIRLLVGIDPEGTLIGVRVLSHRETPGLGDAIEAERSDWILDFDGRSLGNPPADQWRVRRDGGVFDQFSGATVTPRAVVNAVRKSLIYFERHRDELFEPLESDAEEEVEEHG
ncbi:MAG: electron transport complex subunit RsxG [Gammaproteobacteria bacterium]|nr:electron transport complex subunit RsxG [Gammaproteobacteria bacterium]